MFIKRFSFKVVECKNISAVICNRCFKSFSAIDLLREKCLKADKHFRLAIPKQFFIDGLCENKATDLLPDPISTDQLDSSSNTAFENKFDESFKSFVKVEYFPDAVNIKIEPDLEVEQFCYEVEQPTSVTYKTSKTSKTPKKKMKKVRKTLAVPPTTTQTQEKRFRCSQCLENFCSKYLLRDHVIMNHVNFPESAFFNCNHCPAQFRIKSQLLVHLRSNHPTAPKGPKDYRSNINVCLTCLQCFTLKDDLKKHERLAHSANKHIKSRHSSTKIVKKAKLRRNRRKTIGDRHAYTDHTGETFFKCFYCDINFKSHTKRDYHMRSSHEEYDKVVCSTCLKSFKHDSNLKKHQSWGRCTMKEIFPCLHCDQKFKVNLNLRKHVRLNHTQFKCDLCGEERTSTQELRKHFKAKHL